MPMNCSQVGAQIVRAIAADGQTIWYEGFLVVGVYVLFALAFLPGRGLGGVPPTSEASDHSCI